MYQVESQYVDSASGFHVVTLRDGNARHIVQLPVDGDKCPMCGTVFPGSPEEIDPRNAVAQVIDSLAESQARRAAYAKKYGLTIK